MPDPPKPVSSSPPPRHPKGKPLRMLKFLGHLMGSQSKGNLSEKREDPWIHLHIAHSTPKGKPFFIFTYLHPPMRKPLEYIVDPLPS